MARSRIGEVLVQRRRIDAAQLRSALAHQRRWGGRLGGALVKLGFLAERVMLEEVARQLGVALVEIGPRVVPPAVLGLLPARLVRARKVLPLELLGLGGRGPLVVAMADPADLCALDEVQFATGLEVRPLLAAEGDLDQAIARHLYGARPRDGLARDDAIELVDEIAPGPLVREGAGLRDLG